MVNFRKYHIILTSYESLRSDFSIGNGLLSNTPWNYVILDEGHIIKNSKTKGFAATKALNAKHRLLLSGTPIQNYFAELWTLFDFLLPGFLGSEPEFNAKYGKSSDVSSGSSSGIIAAEALHKTLLPFLLRRLKEDVLDDLPPKIIQDIPVGMSEIQQVLYDEANSNMKMQSEIDQEENEEDMKESSKSSSDDKKHIFQTLNQLRKICSHPALVPNVSQFKSYSKVQQLLKESSLPGGIRDVKLSPKLMGLKELLQECGMISSSEESSEACKEAAISNHRALIFCQNRAFLQMIEEDLLKKLGISYLRLDGSVPDSNERFRIVKMFNSDPTIDVLLLTTSVGGLGLNLTGADTVIFMEHDWNPMKDLQAMDRAHRLGQKKTVNVYRFITQGSIEERIMSLQKFKLKIAHTVVNQQNSSLNACTSDILQLFDSAEPKEVIKAAAAEHGDLNEIEKYLDSTSTLAFLQQQEEREEDTLESYT